MHRVRMMSVVIAAGAFAGSSLPASALISGTGYHMGRGGYYRPMPKPYTPHPSTPKSPHTCYGCGGGNHGQWGGGYGGNGGHGWAHWGGYGGYKGHWGGYGGGGYGHTAWHRPALGTHPMGMHFYGMSGNHGYGYGYGSRFAGGKSFGSAGGGTLYARFSAANASLLARFGGGNLATKYGASYSGPYRPRDPIGYGGYHPTPGSWHTGSTQRFYKTGFSYRYSYGYSYRSYRKGSYGSSGYPSSSYPSSGGNWGTPTQYGIK